MKYYVYDSVGRFLRSFPTYTAAFTFKIMAGRYDWRIVKLNNKYYGL